MPEPTKIPRPFADSGDKNSIPDSSGGLGFASWREGFPAITGTPFAQGGVAPKRADFNGVFNALSAATVWNQQGGVYAYDNTTDYEVGNIVLYSGEIYVCLVANGPGSAVKAPTDAATWVKMATLKNALPMSGNSRDNAMTGHIFGGGANDDFAIGQSIDVARLLLMGGGGEANGAFLRLHGKDHSARAGQFFLAASKSSSNQKALVGDSNGTLTWDGNDIATIQTGTWTPVIDGRQTSGTVTKSYSKNIYVKIGPLVYCVVSGVFGPITGGSGSVVLRPSSFPYTIEGNGLSGMMFWNDYPYPMYYYTNDLIYFRKTNTIADLVCSDISSSKTFTMAFVYHTTD